MRTPIHHASNGAIESVIIVNGIAMSTDPPDGYRPYRLRLAQMNRGSKDR